MHPRFSIAPAAILLLAACGGGGSTVQAPPARPPPATPDPAYHLGTARFTTHQPGVLEQIGAHHAYARGLSGRGVRIGIEDSIVDYTQRGEFGSRVRLRDADGASLAYSRPLGDFPGHEIQSCEDRRTCAIWEGNSEDDDEALNRWVRRIVREDGWPTRDDSVFVLDEYYPQRGPGLLFRWSELPTPYGRGAHGTVVAALAAGTNLGVAAQATIVPLAINLTDDRREDAVAGRVFETVVESLRTADRRDLDESIARGVREDYGKFDIINRSHGARTSQLTIAQTARQVAWLQTYLPNSLRAEWQMDRPDSEKTVVVWAAGNDSDPVPGRGAALPYVIPELRGHTLAVIATNPRTGGIAGYSNRCGSLPQDWSTARYGRHYCLAAPGTVRGLVPNPNRPGRGDARSGLNGTSFAAPLVSGSLALLMEHFRGTRGNTQIVKRMIDTADRSGRYADLETYGAGHLDLEAALSPVGSLSAGQSAHALGRTSLQTPAAFGSLADRAGSIELATFDAQEFPFWVPLSALVSQGAAGRSPIPRFGEAEASHSPAPGLDDLALHWMNVGDDAGARDPDGRQWAMGFGRASASLARRPGDGGWGYGLSVDDGGHLGTEASGAFGTDLRSGTMWASRDVSHELAAGWTLKATGTVALSLPQYGKDAMFRATPSMLTAMSARIGTRTTGIVVEQPLRAETGTGRFRVENGRMENGKRLVDAFRVPLRPDGRELRMTLRHDLEALGGTVAMEAGGAVHAGHVPGEREATVGVAWRATW